MDKAALAAQTGAGCAYSGCMLYLIIIVLLFLAFIVGGVIYTLATGQGSLY